MTEQRLSVKKHFSDGRKVFRGIYGENTCGLDISSEVSGQEMVS